MPTPTEGERRHNVRSIEIDQPIEVKFLDNSKHDVVLFAEKHALDQIDQVRKSDSGGDATATPSGSPDGGTVEVVESVEEGNDKRIKRKIQTKKVVSEDPRTNSRITTVTKTETTEVTKVYVLKTDKDLQYARLELGPGLSEEDLVPGKQMNIKSEWSRPRFIGGGTVVHRRSSPCLLSKCLRRRSVHEQPVQHQRFSHSEYPEDLKLQQQQRPMSVYERGPTTTAAGVSADSQQRRRVNSPSRFSNLCRCARSTKKPKKAQSPVAEETIVSKTVKIPVPKQSLSEAVMGKFSKQPKYHPLIDEKQKQVVRQNNLQLSTYILDLINKAKDFKSEEEADRARKMIARSLDLLAYDRCDSWPDYKDQVCAENLEYDGARDLINPVSNVIEHIFTEYDTGDKLKALIDSVPNEKLIADIKLAANAHPIETTESPQSAPKTARKLSTSAEAIPERIKKTGEEARDKLIRPLAKSAKNVAVSAGGVVAAPVAYVASIIKDHSDKSDRDMYPDSSKKLAYPHGQQENVSEIIAEAMESTPRVITDFSPPYSSKTIENLPDLVKPIEMRQKDRSKAIQPPRVSIHFDDSLPEEEIIEVPKKVKSPLKLDEERVPKSGGEGVEIGAEPKIEANGGSKCFSCFGDKSKREPSEGKRKKRSKERQPELETGRTSPTKSHVRCPAPCVSRRSSNITQRDAAKKSGVCGTCLPRRKSSASRERQSKETRQPHFRCGTCIHRRPSKTKAEPARATEIEEPKAAPPKRATRTCTACFGGKSSKSRQRTPGDTPRSKSRTASMEPPRVHLPSIDSADISATDSFKKRFSVGGLNSKSFDISQPLIGQVSADVGDVTPYDVELSTPTITTERDSVLVEQDGRIKQAGIDAPDDYISIHRSEQIDIVPGPAHTPSSLQVKHSPDGSKPPSVQFKIRREEGPAKTSHDEPESDEHSTPKSKTSWFGRKGEESEPKPGGDRDKQGQKEAGDEDKKRHKPLIPWFSGEKHKEGAGSTGDQASEEEKRSTDRQRDSSAGRHKPWFGGKDKDGDGKKRDAESPVELEAGEKTPQELKRIIDFHKNAMRPHGEVGDFYMHPDEEVKPGTERRSSRFCAQESDTIEGIRKVIDDHKKGVGLATGAAIVAGIIDEHKRIPREEYEVPHSTKVPFVKIHSPAERASTSGNIAPDAGEEAKRGPLPGEASRLGGVAKTYQSQYREPLVEDFGVPPEIRSPCVPIDKSKSGAADAQPKRHAKSGSKGDYHGEPLHLPVESSDPHQEVMSHMTFPQSGVASIMSEHDKPGGLIGQEARMKREPRHGGKGKCLTCFGSKAGVNVKAEDAPKHRRWKSAKRHTDKSPHRVASIIHEVSPLEPVGSSKRGSSFGPPSFRLPEMDAAGLPAPLTKFDKHKVAKEAAPVKVERSVTTADEPAVQLREPSHRRSRCFSCGRPAERSPLVLSAQCIDILEYLQGVPSSSKLEKRLTDRLVSQYPTESKSELSKIARKALDRLRSGSVPTLSVLRSQLKQEHPRSAHLVDPIVDVIKQLPAVGGGGSSAGVPDDLLDAMIADARLVHPALLSESQRIHLPNLVKCAESRLLERPNNGLDKRQRKRMGRVMKDAEGILRRQPLSDLNDLRTHLHLLHPREDVLVDKVADELGQLICGGGGGGGGDMGNGMFSFQGPVKILINISHGGEPRFDVGGGGGGGRHLISGTAVSGQPTALLSQRADSNLRRNQSQLRQVIVDVLCEHEKRPQLSTSDIEDIVDKALELLPKSSSFDRVTDSLKTQYPESAHALILSVCNLIEQAYFATEFESLDDKALGLLRDRLSGKPLVLREISFNLPPNTTVCCCECACRCSNSSYRQQQQPPTLDFTLAASDDDGRRQQHQFSSSASFTTPSRSVSLARGLTWREANERARVLFYRGRQPAVRYNSLLHGFDVRMLLEQDGHVQEIPVSQQDVMRLLDSCGLHWDGNQISMLSAEDSDKILKRAEEEAFKILRETGFMRPKQEEAAAATKEDEAN